MNVDAASRVNFIHRGFVRENKGDSFPKIPYIET